MSNVVTCRQEECCNYHLLMLFFLVPPLLAFRDLGVSKDAGIASAGFTSGLSLDVDSWGSEL